MDLVRLLINSVKNNMCFLCFKESANTQNIYCELVVESPFFKETLSLADIVFYLFPSFELTLNKACNSCTDLIIRMYISIHKNFIMKKIINVIIDNLNKEISKYNLSSLDGVGQYSINIDLSKIMDVNIHPRVPLQQHKSLGIDNEDSTYDGILNKMSEESYDTDKQCPNCFKFFDNDKKFKNHIKNHSRIRKKVYYNCSECEYKSLCKQSLQGHINKKHLKIKPFVCSVCYQHFYHKKNLVEHETSHKQVRNEICEVCGDSFIHKKNLLEHLKLHSGDRPYDCDICGKKFITSGRRLEHIKRCHSAKNECCLLCDKKFSLIKELTRHMKTVHS